MIKRMDGWLLAGMVLLLCGAGCAGAIQNAIQIENVASVAASTAHEEIHDLCVEAAKKAKRDSSAAELATAKATCGKAEDAYAAFRAAWLEAADAIHMAQIGQKPVDFDAVMADLESAQHDLYLAIDAIRKLI